MITREDWQQVLEGFRGLRDDFGNGVDKLTNIIRLRWRELVTLVPIVCLVFEGWTGADLVTLFNTAEAFIILALLLNPVDALRFLARLARRCIALVMVLTTVAFRVPGISIAARLLILLCAVSIGALTAWRHKEWKLTEDFIQSAEVNRVLSHITTDGEWEAGKAWSEYGCGETAALLRQGFELVTTEKLLHSVYKGCWQLGYIDGAIELEKEREKHERHLKARDGLISSLKNQLADLQQHEVEQEDYSQEYRKLKKDYDRLSAAFYAQNAELKELRALAAEQAPEVAPLQFNSIAERNAAIVEYRGSHTNAETAEKFGVTINLVKQVIHQDRHKDKVSQAG